LLLARAHYDGERYDETIRTLQRALHIEPQNSLLWYDLAITLYSAADVLLQKGNKASSADAKKAMTYLERAIEYVFLIDHDITISFQN
jgi:tetratricopeptide (TPR) repeat protein